SLGARGTPAFFVNGTLISGAQPLDKFKKIVDDELAVVDKLLQGGAELAAIYAKRVDANFKAPAADRARAEEDDSAVYKVPLGSSAVLGSAEALVTVVVFSEFQCPFCSRIKPTLKQLRDTYKDKLRIAFKHNPLPFHKDAFPASEAALAADAQGKFWEMHDLLFENQKALSREDLDRYAQQLGLDMKRFASDLDQHTFKAAIEEDQRLARQLGAQGTPNSFVNGRKLVGAKGFEDFKKVIDEELARAQALVDKGTPAVQVYEKLTANGLTRAARPTPQLDKKARKRDDPKAVYKVPLPDGEAYARGPKNALVTIMEFSDFQCPYCKRAAETMDQLLQAYPKDVRLVFRHNPLSFHKLAPGASQATLAAGEQGKFWEMHALLFANQKALEVDKLEEYARQIGLDIPRFKSFMEAAKGQGRIDADQKLAMQLGARGTPAFYVNGRKLAGAQPLASFKALVDEELARARELVAKGTSPDKVYEQTIASGASSPVYLVEEDDTGSGGKGTGWQDVQIGNAPTHGGAKAEADVVVFSDFECPYCSRAGEAVNGLLKSHGNRVRVAFKNFPLSFHKNAFQASEAALAAHEQGKFWEMHDLLFKNQKALSLEDLKRYARQIGLNMVKFDEALGSRKFKAQIEADMAQGRQLGVQGTPTIYVNGRQHQGAADAESLGRTVDAELERKKMGKLLGPALRPQDMVNPKLPRKLDLKKLDFNPLKRLPAEKPAPANP
ncbi:MAG: hypothetical protein FJ125_11965, partial [Deltaproteobacteria bacterium]|nr:hypothetical protein [Deltaproteobacteria bacterium]